MSRARPLAALALVLALAAVGAALARARCGEPPRPQAAPAPTVTPPAVTQPPDPAPPAPLPELRVESALGVVERTAPGGAWTAVAPGDVLRQDEQLRTGARSQAELSAGGGSRVTISERTQLTLRELTTAMHRFRLTRGLVAVDYQPDGARTVRIEDPGGAAAESKGARFQVAASGLTFAVATETGGVTLSAGGAEVALAAGETTRTTAGAAPAPPSPISREVLLKVARASKVGGAHCLDTRGRTEPGALVTVAGEEVEVGPDGVFPLRVDRELPRGVIVRVVLPGGRELTRTVPCSGAAARIRELKMRWMRESP
jgi:hypothetical protein